MHARHTTTPLQALYRIFVLPTLTQPVRQPALRQRLLPTTTATPTTRLFSHTPPRPSKTRAPELRTQKWDAEITSPTGEIYLIPPDTNRLVHPETSEHVAPVSLAATLRALDPKTHRLIQLSDNSPSSPVPSIPVCKIISKKEAYESDKKRKLLQKEQKRVQKVVTEQGQKTIELNWAIAEGDLSHRLGRLKEFLGEGRRVEVVLAGKKRGRKATREECENVLSRVKEAVESVDGAKEKEAWQGKMGGFMSVTFQGKPVKATVASGTAGADLKHEE